MKMVFPMVALLAAAASAVHAQAPPPKPAAASKPVASKSALDKAFLEDYVRYLLLWSPQVEVTVGDPKPGPMPGFSEVVVTGKMGQARLDEVFYVSKDGKNIVRGSFFDVSKSPFEDELRKISVDLSPSMGTPGAKALIVIFSDFQCSYCREEAKVIRENLLKEYPTQVRLYFKDMPIDALHPWARAAAIAGRCVFRQNPQAFWTFHDWIFENQPGMTVENLKAKVTEWAGAQKLDGMQLARCMDARSTEPEIEKSIAEARNVRVNSTPTLIINGRILPGSMPWGQLKTIIDMELDRAKKTGFEPEKCCQVTLSPLPNTK